MNQLYATFWMVWMEGGGVPTVKHPTREAAEKEAERLANAHPGKQFHVMESVCACQKMTVTWAFPDEFNEVPF